MNEGYGTSKARARFFDEGILRLIDASVQNDGELGGRFSMKIQPGGGTRVYARLPL